MKKVVVLSPSVSPLPLVNTAPEIIKDGNIKINFKELFSSITEPGVRAWKIAEILSADKELEVTLYIPNSNFPKNEYIDFSKIPFYIQPYNIKAATWNWSEELDKKLKDVDFVIVQTTAGVGFQNCTVLPGTVNVIVDGYNPIFAEMPCKLLSSSKIYRRIFWDKFMSQYVELLRRANCVLYANDRQYYYYEGQFFSIKKLDWKAFQFSPLLKVPFGINRIKETQKHQDRKEFSLLWSGSIHLWHEPEKILEQLELLPNVEIRFPCMPDIKYSKFHHNIFKKYFNTVDDRHNVTVSSGNDTLNSDLYSQYDSGILLARDWLEEKYSIRSTVLDMLSFGLPVLLNKGNPLFDELNYLTDSIYPISSNTIYNDLINYSTIKPCVSKESLLKLQEQLSWDVVIKPLLEYIKRF